MSSNNKITDSVYSVGVLNPNLRVFDIVMETEYGTSYNSYLVKGSKSAALIETVHIDFFDTYIQNIESVIELDKIEYLIMNHNEPDHSGSIKKILELIPNIKVVVSQAGSIYLKNIVNEPSLVAKIVKDGEIIDLGGKELVFYNSPFLHWPDSMFTYLKQEKVLFSCDFFGAHYCEPTSIDTSISEQQENAYFTSLKGYFDAIFSPFKQYVVLGLNTISKLDIDFVGTSHGPILSKNKFIPKVVELYQEWSKPIVRENKLIPIFYCSAYQNTEQLAIYIKEGINEVLPTAQVETYDLINYSMSEMGDLLNKSDAFLIGSPTINRDAVPPVWVLLSHIDAINIPKRPVALFGSYGWSGEALKNLRSRLTDLKANVQAEDFRVQFIPTNDDLDNAKEYGKKFATENFLK